MYLLKISAPLVEKLKIAEGQFFHVHFRLWSFRNRIGEFKQSGYWQVQKQILGFKHEPVKARNCKVCWTYKRDFWIFTSEKERENLCPL